MLVEADFVSERFVAVFAGEGSLPAVRPPRVDVEAVRRREDLVALQTRENVPSAYRHGPRVADGVAGERRSHRSQNRRGLE